MSFPGNALNRLNTMRAVGWLKYWVKAGAETPAPEAAFRVAESTRYEEESLRGSVKLLLNSRRVLARFRPPSRLHNSRIYVQRGPIKTKTLSRPPVLLWWCGLIMRRRSMVNFSTFTALLFNHSSSRVLCRSNKNWWRR